MSRRLASRSRPFVEAAACGAALLGLTWISFGPAFHAEFVSDDVNAIVENEWVAGPFDPAGIVANHSWWGSGRPDSVAWRPAATMSFAAGRAVFGDAPSAFRAINFVLHALCAGLVLALARRLGLGAPAAAVAAGLFALLPIHSEAVIWIVGRAELGAAIGFFAAALACLDYRRRGRAWTLAVAAASIAIGMAFKENAVTALAAPAIFWLTKKESTRSWQRDAHATAALAAGIGAYLLLRTAAGGASIAAEPGSLLDNPLSVVDPPTRLLGALAAFGRYVALTFWPSSLSVDYSWNALGIGEGFRANADTAIALAFLAAATWACRRAPARRDVIAAALLLAAASFSIVSNTVFVIGTILGERLFYLPSAGLCIAVAALAEPHLPSIRTRSRSAVAAVGVLLVVAVAAIAVNRARAAEWRTPVTLFEAAVREVPRSARARMELASAYGYAGRVDDASREFAVALEILPDYAAAAYNQGNTLARARRFDEAAAAYRRALEADPYLTRAWHNLALTEKLRGNEAGWIEGLQAAIETSPGSLSIRTELAEALLAARRYPEALSAYDALLAAGDRKPSSWFNRGVARHNLGGCAAALEDYLAATRAPGAPRETFAAAAGCLRQLGRSEEAASLERSGKVANRDTRR